MKKIYYSLCFSLIAFCNTSHAQNISTVAGDGTIGYGGDGGLATAAQFQKVYAVALDDTGNMYVADRLNNRVRKVTIATGIITTFAGNGTGGFTGDGGPATAAEINTPVAISVDDSNNVYFVTYNDSRIRKVSAATGIITTIAGTGVLGYNGDGIAATTAQLNNPWGLHVDDTGNVYIADYYNNRVRKITAATGIISTVAGNGVLGYNNDGIAATDAEIYYPTDVDVDDTGNIYFSDEGNNRIRKVTAATGLISTIAGNGNIGYNGDGIPATTAYLYYPYGLTVDRFGNVYEGEFYGTRLRKIDAVTGLISTLTGNGTMGYDGDGIPAATAEVNAPIKVAVNDTGTVFIADAYNSRIRSFDQYCSSVTAGTLHLAGLSAGCDSVSDTFTLSGDNFGAGIVYQWKSSTDGINWTNVGTNSEKFMVTSHVTTYFKGFATCTFSGISDSTTIDTITVNPAVTPTAVIAASPGTTIAPGTTVTFTATVTNGGNTTTYQWQKNNVAIAAATNSTYATNAIVDGDIFNCIVHSDAPCALPDSAVSNTDTMHITEGVQQVTNTLSLSLFPNPNDGTFVIDGTLNNDKEAAIEITNVVGQVVYTATVTANKGRLHNSITLPANIGNGVYTIHVKSTTQSATQKIVISK